MYVCMYVCMYAYIYIYICTYVCIYTYRYRLRYIKQDCSRKVARERLIFMYAMPECKAPGSGRDVKAQTVENRPQSRAALRPRAVVYYTIILYN